jgi:N-acetylneuraminic acid mutarotase
MNRGSHGSSSVEGTVFVVGGGGFKSNLNNNEKFDPVINKWLPISEMPTSRHALQVIAHKSFLYAIGGWIDGSVCSGDNECYDIGNDSWTIRSPMKHPRRLFGIAELNDRIFTFGGNIKDGSWYSDIVEIYDTKLDIWYQEDSLPVAGQCSAVVVGNCVYVLIHGNGLYKYDYTATTASKLKYLKLCDFPLKEWYCFDCVGANGDILVIGGASCGKWLNVMYKYDILLNAWIEMPSMKKQRRRCSATVCKILKL